MLRLSTLLSLPVLLQGYEATWESLDSRPLPQWYPEAKLGIFIHWGVFSVPAFGSEWFWNRWIYDKQEDYIDYVNATEYPRFNYQDYAHRFDATLFDPDAWANVFASSGAQYVVLTSKHHEGYCMWDSRDIPTTWNWNVMDIGPRRDLFGDLSKAVRKVVSPQTQKPLKFGAYHSWYEWFNPLYKQDAANDFRSQMFVDTKTLPELYDLVEKYEVEVIWGDGDWNADSNYWKSKEFLAWLATNSSVRDTVVWNDRFGNDTRCTHGSFWNCHDKYIPNATMSHYFENCYTMDKNSWGKNRLSGALDYLTTSELLNMLVKTISRNGNLLINVGPGADGTISPIMVDRLLEMGKWLNVNGEAVYSSQSWTVCSEESEVGVYYTRSVDRDGGDVLFAFLTQWPRGNQLTLSCPVATEKTTARMLGVDKEEWQAHGSSSLLRGPSDDSLELDLPSLTPDKIPCNHIWTGEPANLFHVVFPDEPHHRYASHLLNSQDLEENEVSQNLLEETPAAKRKREAALSEEKRYEATWESLDSRPLPQWYPEAKLGIFIHWGVFSVPAFGSEWFWNRWIYDKQEDYIDYVNATEYPRFNYQDYAHRFDATLFDPDAWANVFASSGAQYVVLTSKHHEGYCMWDSRDIPTTWNWNVMDIGPRRDLFGDLSKAVRKVVSPQTQKPLKFGAYHSWYEWFNPLYKQDAANDFRSQMFVDTKTLPELYDLVEKYEVEVIWGDGDWNADSNYWKSKEFLAWLATNSSVRDTVVWNDRFGNDTRCTHGSFWNCHDKYIPNATMSHYFENCYTMDKNSWGKNRLSGALDYLTTSELLNMLVKTISRNGNLLINVGPGADGTISPIMVDRLLEMGKWLNVNGEAVYSSQSWTVCSEESEVGVYYTRSVDRDGGDVLFAFLTQWPRGNQLTLSCPVATEKTTARMLGVDKEEWQAHGSSSLLRGPSDDSLELDLPSLTPDKIPCNHIWVIALEGIGNLERQSGDAFSSSPQEPL
eukprot:Nitzschia sp. Nitz4//scaffold192_size41448//24317//28613//NITZ4_007486-RA/size41448-snap-gene-0.53-mRNA-1//-1//CDS//3329540239//8942//frame0